MDKRRTLHLHLSADLHRWLKSEASIQGVTMQQFVAAMLARLFLKGHVEKFVWKGGDVQITRPTGRRVK